MPLFWGIRAREWKIDWVAKYTKISLKMPVKYFEK